MATLTEEQKKKKVANAVKWNREHRERHAEQVKKWYQNHKELFRDKRIAAKKKVFEHYGGKCACCGESNFWFLTLDHINNDGYLLGRARNTMKPEQIIRRGFPGDLQLLCYNCNCAKNNPMYKNICPHKWEEKP